MRIDPSTGLGLADVTKVSAPYRYPRDGRWHHYRVVTIRCPYCRGTHTHEWATADPEPGVQTAPCPPQPYFPTRYLIPAPGPHTAIPGVCGRPTQTGAPCARAVPCEGQPCHQHQEQTASPKEPNR